MPDKAAIEKYARAHELTRAAADRIRQSLLKALREIGNPELVRASLRKPRIKTLMSVARKANEKGWTVEEAIEKCCDFVGLRVVCNNLQDAERAADLVEGTLQNEGLKTERLDYVEAPRNSGYRAIHIIAWVPVAFAQDQMTLGSEIQIRTYLQDAWGELSRADLFKADIPAPLRRRTRQLADILARADRIAESIRRQVTKPRKGKKPRADAPLSASALAFIYRRAFGKNPPEYVVESALQEYADSPIRADALDVLLQDQTFIDRVREAYSSQTKWGPYPESIFRWAVRAAARGKKSAIGLAARDARQDWAEVDAQYKSELSHAVPETWEELKDQLEGRDADLDSLIRYFDAIKTCFCGEEMVDFDSFADSIVTHYRLGEQSGAEAYEIVRDALVHAEYEEYEGRGVCTYHDYIFHKDD